MKNFTELVRTRRSIRHYTQDAVSEQTIASILEAGRWAPSGLNNQPWRFLVITDKQKRELVASFTKYAKIVKEAPAVILVFLDQGATYNRDKDVMAIGACIQNMLLAAHAVGVGTCWLGEILNRKEALVQALEIGKDFELMAAITVGMSDDDTARSSRVALKKLLIR